MNRDYAAYTQCFEACRIDAATFTHADHVGVAYELLRTYPFLKAVTIYAECLQKIATEAGAADKFNLTITLAFLSVIAERFESCQAATFADFIDANPDLLTGRPLAQWYSAERLQSAAARSVFLLPDKAA